MPHALLPPLSASSSTSSLPLRVQFLSADLKKSEANSIRHGRGPGDTGCVCRDQEISSVTSALAGFWLIRSLVTGHRCVQDLSIY